jgi:hypothetical protein
MTLAIKTADELIDAELEARWAGRRAARQTHVLQKILQIFVDCGEPITVDALPAALPDLEPGAVREAVVKLDEDDLIQIVDGRIEIAYPFSAKSTPFVVRLPEGGERYVCCAIDALGMAPMLGQTVAIRSRCHHCGESMEMSVTPEAPSPGCEHVMVWVGKQIEGERRVATSL